MAPIFETDASVFFFVKKEITSAKSFALVLQSLLVPQQFPLTTALQEGINAVLCVPRAHPLCTLLARQLHGDQHQAAVAALLQPFVFIAHFCKST